MLGNKEARAAARTILRCPARLGLPGGAVLKARTFDISMAGMSVTTDSPVPAGQRCQIAFEALSGGKPLKINVTGRVVHCSLSGTEGFRVGFHFEQNDEATAKAIRQLLS